MLYPNRLKTRPIVSSGYGWRIHPITGVRTFHYGVDSYGHPNGWNGAPEAGVVVYAGYNGGAGLAVHIQGRTRLWKLYHHARIDVAVGQQVNEGTVTGLTGTTGASTGVHCHTECWAGSASQDAFDYIAANLGGTAGGGGSPFPNLNRKAEKMILFSTKDGGQKYHILHSGGVYTFTSGTSSFPNAVAERIGDAIPTDEAFIAAMKAQYAAQNPPPGKLDLGDITVEADNTKVLAALAELTAAIKAQPKPPTAADIAAAHFVEAKKAGN